VGGGGGVCVLVWQSGEAGKRGMTVLENTWGWSYMERRVPRYGRRRWGNSGPLRAKGKRGRVITAKGGNSPGGWKVERLISQFHGKASGSLCYKCF